MTAKTLDQEVMGMNDGLVSMGVVKEAPENNLPEVVEEDPYKGIKHLFELAAENEKYKEKAESLMDIILVNNGFEKKDSGYYERNRGSHLDYIFPRLFNSEKGTFGITLEIEKFDEFERLLKAPSLPYSNNPLGGWGVVGGAGGGVVISSSGNTCRCNV